MLLATATIDGSVYRFSDRQHNLVLPWRNRIKKFDIPSRSLSSSQGGGLQWSDGSIVMYPNFCPVWPPPETFAMEIVNSEDGLTTSQWFDGSVYIESSDFATEVPYALYGGAYAATVAKGYAFSGTLISVCSWAATQLGLTLDSTLARSPSTPIVHTMQREARITDVLDAMCKYATHMYWTDRQAGILHLVAMETDNGARSLRSSQVFSPTYPKLAPVAEITATVSGEAVVQMSAFTDGNTETIQPYHTNATYVDAELTRALSILNARRISIGLPLTNDIPAPGEKITLVNDTTYQPTTGWFRVRSYAPKPEQKKIFVAGEGAIV